MREIKFRAWDKFHEEMLDWETLLNFDGFYLMFSKQHKSKYIIQQYTGLKDKNGKEIYEGDIVRADTMKGYQYEHTMVVRYEEHNARYYPFYTSHKGYEVIGNIYENPDLLTT